MSGQGPRHRPWTWRGEQPDGDNRTQRHDLRVAAGDEPVCPHACELTLPLTLHTKVNSLTLRRVAHNTGSEAFDGTGGLHRYFALTEAPSTGVSGLRGLSTPAR